MRVDQPKVLLTGASGYVGGRLLKSFEAKGVAIRVLARKPLFLQSKIGPLTQIVQGDALDQASLEQAMQGIELAYYLIYSMSSAKYFQEQDRKAALHFAQAAKNCKVKRIIYLGGLGVGKDLSTHLSSRQEVGHILRESGIQTLEFRASIIIGSGSLSFEMIRALVEKLPVMLTPRWVNSLAQPIAIEDVISYLLAGQELPLQESLIVEIGGKDRISYLQIMKEYARQRGLSRLMIPVPVLSPRISSLWLGLVTPVYARIGRKLIDSVRHETVVTDRPALKMFAIEPKGIREAIARALVNEDREFAQTRWSDALSSRGKIPSWGGEKFRTRIVDSRVQKVMASAEKTFRAIIQMGGVRGWYFANFLWRLRGFLDLVAGGVGLRRGRRNSHELSPGDTLDFWRVEAVEKGKLLRLYAEMKLPGRAWLQFEVDGNENESFVRQTAIFDPLGFVGLAYWYVLYPIHRVIFKGMLKGIARESQRNNQF